MFKKIESILSNDYEYLYQEEIIELDINLNNLWEIVTDWRNFIKFVHQITVEIHYFGNPHEIGTEMKIFLDKNKSQYYNLRVIEYEKNKNITCRDNVSKDCDINTTTNHSCKISNLVKNEKFEKDSYKKKDNKFSKNIFKTTYYNKLKINDFNDKKEDEFYKLYKNLKNDKLNKKEKNKELIESINNLGKNSLKQKTLKPDVNLFVLEDRDSKFFTESIKTNDENRNLLNCRNESKYVLECYEGKPRCPLQHLIFKFVELCENRSLLTFRHEFKEPVKPELIKKIRNEKKIILRNLKNSI